MRFAYSEAIVVDSEKEPWKREGLRAGIYGAPGSTKSYTAAAFLVEQFLAQGGTLVLFEPRAEWHTLKAKYPDVQVIGGPYQDALFLAEHPKPYADAVVQQGVSMVFYTAEVEEEEKLVAFVERFLSCLMKGEEGIHRPIMVVFEEAHEYAPQNAKGHVAPPWVFARMIRRCVELWKGGRKLNVIPVALTQRPQELAFTVRQLCNLSLFGSFGPQDVAYLDKEVLAHYRRDGLDVRAEKLRGLKPGEFLIIEHGRAVYEMRAVKRQTPHGADTPSMDFVPPASEKVKSVISDLGKQLNEIRERQAVEESEVDRLKREKKDLETKVQDLESKVRLASDLKSLFSGGPKEVSENVQKRIIELETTVEEQKGRIDSLQKQVAEKEVALTELQRKDEPLEALLRLIDERIDLRLIDVLARSEVADARARTVRANVDTWINNPHVPEPARKFLEVFRNAPKGAIFTRSQLAVEAKYSPSSSNVGTAISYLKVNRLIEEGKQGIKLAGE